MASKKERKHDLKDIKNYCRTKIFPKRLAGKGKKANFRWTTKCFSIKNGQSYYKESRLVITDKDRQLDIIHDIHEGLGDTSHSKAMSAHFGRTPTYEKLAARFFWYGIYNDVTDNIKKCDRCQRQSSLPPKVKNEMHSVPVSPHIMKQVALDLCLLPEVDGYHHLIVSIDYFTKWSEANPIRDKTALTVAVFLYELCVVLVASKAK